MQISHFVFGVLEIDRVTYEHDGVIDRGEIQKRNRRLLCPDGMSTTLQLC